MGWDVRTGLFWRAFFNGTFSYVKFLKSLVVFVSLYFSHPLSYQRNMNQTLAFSRVSTAQHWPVHLSATPITEDTEIQCTKFVASAITFKTTDVFVQKLERLTREHIFNEQDWSAFITFCIRVWTCCIIFAAFLMYVLFYDK